MEVREKVSEYLPIRQVSPFIAPHDDWAVCVIRAYLDGSAGDGVIGLAAYVATFREWERFENRWGQILRHLNMSFLHMRDLSQRIESFAGKDTAQAHSAAADLIAYLRELHDWSYRRYSCVIRQADYVRAQADIPSLRDKPLHAMCVDNCLGRIFNPLFREEDDPEKNIQIIFDGNEAFIRHIRRVWNVEKDLAGGWARYVDSITEQSNGKMNRPMQAADALAWVSRRYRDRGDYAEWHEWLCGQPRTQTNIHEFYDYDALVARYGAASVSEPPAHAEGQP